MKLISSAILAAIIAGITTGVAGPAPGAAAQPDRSGGWPRTYSCVSPYGNVTMLQAEPGAVREKLDGNNGWGVNKCGLANRTCTVDGDRFVERHLSSELIELSRSGGTYKTYGTTWTCTPQAAASARSIGGTYRLFMADKPNAGVIASIQVRQSADGSIRVDGTDQPWSGTGEVRGAEGYYNWRFSDGKTGRTQFHVNPDGTLRGHVQGSGIDWWFLARP
jgi:hypothetical protein